MSKLTSHVLDTALGRPAAQLAVRLERLSEGREPELCSASHTDDNGRVHDLLPERALEAGLYRLVFDTGSYFARSGRTTFYPRVEIVFEVLAPHEHHHVPLLLSPFGFATYRGS